MKEVYNKKQNEDKKMSQFEQIKDQLSLGADYEAVAAKYRPIFNKIEEIKGILGKM